jgi:hypothetical protein
VVEGGMEGNFDEKREIIEGIGKDSRQLTAGSRQRDNAHCAFINYHLAFYSNDSNSVICDSSMINAN